VYVPVVPVAPAVLPSLTTGAVQDFATLETESPSTSTTRTKRQGQSLGVWIAAGFSVLISLGIVLGVVQLLRPPQVPDAPMVADVKPKPTSTAKPPSRPIPLKSDPNAVGRGLQFEPEQFVVIPGLTLPTQEPFTIEGYVTVDRDSSREGHIFGTKFVARAVIADRDGIVGWETHANVGLQAVNAGGLEVVRNKRTHVAMVRSRTEIRLFIDGKQIGTAPAQGLLPLLDRPVTLGGESFRGVMDAVRVSGSVRYDRGDFTPDERFEVDNDTLALYRFEEGEGDELKDFSGNGRHGRIVGATWLTIP
jgi:hypothetical protein